MIKSMTGFGRGQMTFETQEITVELRAVNHRYFECSSRVPRAYAYLEEPLKSHLKGTIARGKVEVSLQVTSAQGGEPSQVQVNRNLARAYCEALRGLSEELQIKNDISVSLLARFPELFSVSRPQEDPEEMWERVRQTADLALEQFLQMRQTEGQKLQQDLEKKLQNMEGWIAQVEEQSPRTLEQYRSRLLQKLQELLGDSSIDESRILTEAAIFADKIAVDEETVRLRSHIHQFRQILAGQEPAGRKLDFLVQEMNREVNTIGSKAQDVEIAKIVVDCKAEIEKIREQIQNIE